MIAARVPYTPPPLGQQYNSSQIRTALGALARSVPPQTTREAVAATTVDVMDDLIVCDATGGAFTVTLPPADQVQFLKVSIKRINGGGNAVTIGGTVDASVNPTLASQWSAITVQSDGTRWLKLASV